MRSGRHFVQLTVLAGEDMVVGVIRPGWDVEGGGDAHTVDGHCFYWAYFGDRYRGEHDWEGMHDAREQGDRIGMLVDPDQGSMTVWKNDVKLGVMVAEGLRGPLCWAVTIFCGDSGMIDVGIGGTGVRIESAPAPASPAEEELAAARNFTRRLRREGLGLPLLRADD